MSQQYDIRSVWVVRPNDLYGRTGRELNGIHVDYCEWPDGSIKWAIRSGSSVLGKDGTWILEPIPSSRTDEFYSTCRFDSLDEAIQFARKKA